MCHTCFYLNVIDPQLTFTAGQRVAPLSSVLALQHWLPQQVEAGIAGKVDLAPGFQLHGGGVQVGDSVLQGGAIWRNPNGSGCFFAFSSVLLNVSFTYRHRKCCSG